MITKITGRLVLLTDDTAILAADPFEYEVAIPEFTRRQLQGQIGQGVTLHTIYQIDGNAATGKLQPRLIGFLTEVEREFFELFCSVDGVGTRKALRAMVRPVPDVAQMIEEQDVKGLSALPGVGPALSERIVAKLRRKVPKFALLIAKDLPAEASADRDVIRETFSVLVSLGHPESEARRLIDGVIAQKKKFKDVEAMIHAVYQFNLHGKVE
jgi:Holliday junction DNA helicase RuvA